MAITQRVYGTLTLLDVNCRIWLHRFAVMNGDNFDYSRFIINVYITTDDNYYYTSTGIKDTYQANIQHTGYTKVSFLNPSGWVSEAISVEVLITPGDISYYVQSTWTAEEARVLNIRYPNGDYLSYSIMYRQDDGSYIELHRTHIGDHFIEEDYAIYTSGSLSYSSVENVVYGDNSSVDIENCGHTYNGYLSLLFTNDGTIDPYAVFEFRKCANGKNYVFIETYSDDGDAYADAISMWFNKGTEASPNWVLLNQSVDGAIPYSESTFKFNETLESSIIDIVGCINCNGSKCNVGSRGIFAGGNSSNDISYITITTLGNANEFGQLTSGRSGLAGCSSSTRGIFAGGADFSGRDIDYITIATLGNAINFGDLTTFRDWLASCSSSTRGIFAGGMDSDDFSGLYSIDYITITTLGNANEFGNMTSGRMFGAGCSSSTRGIFAGGMKWNSSLSGKLISIDYITIATLGNAINFGNLTVYRYLFASCSSSTRGIFAGGSGAGVMSTTTIDYITIATLGNAINFGDLTTDRYNNIACSSFIRGIIASGYNNAAVTIDYITIATLGNAINFGDLTPYDHVAGAACSNCHGGL